MDTAGAESPAKTTTRQQILLATATIQVMSIKVWCGCVAGRLPAYLTLFSDLPVFGVLLVRRSVCGVEGAGSVSDVLLFGMDGVAVSVLCGWLYAARWSWYSSLAVAPILPRTGHPLIP